MATFAPTPTKRRIPAAPRRPKEQAPMAMDVCTALEADEEISLDPSSELTACLAPLAYAQSVDDENVEDAIRSKAIGQKIRALRLKRSMGLIDLGKKTGMSASFLSQLETGRVVPTLRNLSRIALVFNKDLNFFFQDDKRNQFKKSRAKDRIRLTIGDKSAPIYISESMSALIPDRSLVPCIAEFIPNARNEKFEPTTFKGQEFVYVIQGSLTLSTEHERQELGTADVVWIDGATKRQYKCNDGLPARAMFITFPKKG